MLACHHRAFLLCGVLLYVPYCLWICCCCLRPGYGAHMYLFTQPMHMIQAKHHWYITTKRLRIHAGDNDNKPTTTTLQQMHPRQNGGPVCEQLYYMCIINLPCRCCRTQTKSASHTYIGSHWANGGYSVKFWLTNHPHTAHEITTQLQKRINCTSALPQGTLKTPSMV